MKDPKLTSGKMYLVKWLDHCSCYYTWTNTSEIDESDMPCETCGFFIKESKTCYFFSLNRYENKEKHGSIMQVLKSATISIKEVK